MTAPTPRLTTSIIVAAGLLSAVAPVATDLYLPAFPAMTGDLNASTAAIQMSLTAFFIGAGVGQAVFGPLSDRLGRRVPLLAGAALFVVFSAAAALAPTVTMLVAFRLLQGLAGAAGAIADLAHGREAAGAFSALMIVGGVAPVIAPVVGSLGATTIGWRGLLWVVAGLGLVAVVVAAISIPETRPAQARLEGRSVPFSVIARELATRQYIGAVLAFGAGFATMMAYISASPFVYQNMMGMGPVAYGIAFGVNALLLMVVSAAAMRLVPRLGVHRLARTGLAISGVGVLAVGAVVLCGLPIWLLAIFFAVVVAPLGLVFGTATGLALDAVRDAAGVASAVLGLVQFVFAGAVAPLVGLAGEESAVPVAITMLAATVVANVAIWVAGGRFTPRVSDEEIAAELDGDEVPALD